MIPSMDIGGLIRALLILSAFGLWKIAEVAWWIVMHINIDWVTK